MATFQQLVSDVRAEMDSNNPVMLWGAPGIGKTALPKQIAKDDGRALIYYPAPLYDAVDVGGLPAVIDGRTIFTRPDVFPRLDRDGPNAILLIDEINAAAPSVQAAFFSLVLEREVKGHRLPDCTRIICTGNRQSDRAAAQRMPTALQNRMSHYTLEASAPDWCAYAARVGIHPAMVAFIEFRPMLLHKMPDSADQPAFPTPRSTEAAAKHIATAPDLMTLERRIRAHCGEAFSREFSAFFGAWQFAKDRLGDILRNPDNAPLPDSAGDTYAVASFLSNKADRANLAHLLRYVDRLPRDYGVQFMTAATTRNPDLKSTAAHIEWCVRNQDVVL